MEAAQLCLHTSAKISLAHSLTYIAHLFKELGEAVPATRLLAYAGFLVEASGFVMHRQLQGEVRKAIADLQSIMGKKTWQLVWEKGRAMTRDEAVSEALMVAETIQRLAGAPARDESAKRPQRLFDLTRREVEVLKLVAGGLTDAQIAGTLFLSRNTVHAHIHSIYSKLDVTNRAGAIRFAVESRLA
jgi:DNA-binding NarL/FixJ family response regulator